MDIKHKKSRPSKSEHHSLADSPPSLFPPDTSLTGTLSEYARSLSRKTAAKPHLPRFLLRSLSKPTPRPDILVLGPPNAGKSSLIARVAGKRFDPDAAKPPRSAQSPQPLILGSGARWSLVEGGAGEEG
eukprot:CAMPEP_0184709912 /NCGR_PEP_ID=MMETSP0314-20130426/923_1 /TAXON_ID=38298 /ORGANISM="Rhodella maculata, Strain CCMP 736" /LENGTH=128 /DNA_ID=CAMNT_0027171687 /DNA_START=64 /DNA_END=447 /DNA_ORIENTATION=-